MVGIPAEGLGNDFFQPGFDLVDVVARRQAGSVAHPKDVGVDCKGFLAECRVEDNVCGLAPDARQFLQLITRARDVPSVIADQGFGERNDVLGLSVEQADRLDLFAKRILAQLDHLPWSFDVGE